MTRRSCSPIFFLTATVLLSVFSLLVAARQSMAQSSNQYALLRKPTISKTQIAFSYGGDLWVVDRNGGDARRLDQRRWHRDRSDFFSRRLDARSPSPANMTATKEDVYVIPTGGGIPNA